MTPNTLTRTFLALGAVATLALSTGACSTGSETKADTKSASATNDAGSSATSTTPTDTDTDRDAGSGGSTAPKADAEPIGSTTGQHRADPGDDTLVPLELDVLAVERVEGETIQVRFRITNASEDTPFEPWVEMGDPTSDGKTYDVGGVAILDRPNDKKYLTLFDSDGTCLCTSGTDQLAIAPGESADLYADVTAPPESVKTVDVTFPGFQPVNGLEIS